MLPVTGRQKFNDEKRKSVKQESEQKTVEYRHTFVAVRKGKFSLVSVLKYTSKFRMSPSNEDPKDALSMDFFDLVLSQEKRSNCPIPLIYLHKRV